MRRWMFGAAMGLGLVACSFGTLQVVATPAEITADVIGVAATRDHARAWALDASGTLTAMDPATNAVLSSTNLSFIGPVALTGESDRVDAVLMLSDWGILRWSTGATDLVAPAPVADELCDLTADLDGDIYVSTLENGAARIHRLPSGSQVYDAPVAVGATTCVQISADPTASGIAVLEPGSDSVDLYSDALVFQGTTTLSALFTEVWDVDFFGGHFAAVGDDDLGWVIVQYLGLLERDGDLVDAQVVNGEVDGQRVHFVDDSALGTLETWVGGGVAVWQAMVGRYPVLP